MAGSGTVGTGQFHPESTSKIPVTEGTFNWTGRCCQLPCDQEARRIPPLPYSFSPPHHPAQAFGAGVMDRF